MSEVIDRVAKALYKNEAGTSEGWDGPLLQEGGRNMWRGIARAAIEAMREPTNEMAEVGAAAATTTQRGAWFGWKAMIDAALRG